MTDIPQSWNIGPHALFQSSETTKQIMDDPRGLLHVWEPPIPNAKYIMSLDPTFGITGWSRATRIDGDHKIDNAAIQILRVNALRRIVMDPLTDRPRIDRGTGQPEFVLVDLQVAEYFAPIDAVQSARIANVLGRIYKGDADDQCELIYEAWPGPGVLTTQELLRVGYTNLWEWEYIADATAESTGKLGWRSSDPSQTLLWTRARRHLMSNRVKVLSPWLLGELRDAIIHPVKMRAVAANGVHDDLLQALSMGLWAGHKWSYDAEHVVEPISEGSKTDWQLRAPDLNEEQVPIREQWKNLVDSWG